MRSKIGNVLWGIFFIVLGVGFAGKALFNWDFNLFFPGWWTLFIIVPCGISIFQNGFHVMPISGLVVGILLFMGSNNLLDAHIVSKLIFPLILIIIGLSIIFRGMFHGPGKGAYAHPKDGALDYTATFSGQNIHYNNELFTGATLNAIFGGVELKLQDAIINEDVVINCSAIFGGIDIFVPGDVNVKVSSTSIFGGVDNKRRSMPNIQGAPTIYVNATCLFGGVDVK